MKVFKYLDFGIQTFILAPVVLITLFVLFMGNFETIGMAAMYGAFFLGPWQLLSSFVTTLLRIDFFRLRLIHLISAILYLIGLSLVAMFHNELNFNGTVNTVGGFFGFGVPAILAFFYYYITVKTLRIARAASVSA